MKTTITIKGNIFKFCNFFADVNGDRDRPFSYECEEDKEYTEYSLNTFEGQQKRMEYSAKNRLLNIQLGNTSTVLFGNNEEIFGLHPSIFDIFENADEVGIDKSCEFFKDEIDYDNDEFIDEKWFKPWKEGIDETIIFAKEYYGKLTHYGEVSNEMWRIMGAEPEVIAEYNLKNDRFNDFVDVPIQPGTWEIISTYDGNNPIYFTMKLNKNKK